LVRESTNDEQADSGLSAEDSKVTQVAIALREYPLDPPRTNILGVGISAITMVTAVSLIEKWIAKHDHQYVCIATVHSVMESQRI
jgi:UDP-N-acetyl-D-mannosaminuronic acid transferase (WecB/TagA/CpsF family)